MLSSRTGPPDDSYPRRSFNRAHQDPLVSANAAYPPTSRPLGLGARRSRTFPGVPTGGTFKSRPDLVRCDKDRQPHPLAVLS